MDAGAEWLPVLPDGARLRAGAQYAGTLYPGNGSFNDMTSAAYAGPRFLNGRWDVSPLLTGFEQWYGNRFYNRGIGATLLTVYYPTPTVSVISTMGVQQVTYGPPTGQNGPAISGGLGFSHAVDLASAISGGLSLTRQQATDRFYTYTAAQIRLGYDRDLPSGWSASMQLSCATINYDDALAAFGRGRHDQTWVAQVSLLNRRIDFYGFTPRISYIFTHNVSTVSFYSYDRSQIEIGVTRAF
jgi:hypothetical protein